MTVSDIYALPDPANLGADGWLTVTLNDELASAQLGSGKGPIRLRVELSDLALSTGVSPEQHPRPVVYGFDKIG